MAKRYVLVTFSARDAWRHQIIDAVLPRRYRKAAHHVAKDYPYDKQTITKGWVWAITPATGGYSVLFYRPKPALTRVQLEELKEEVNTVSADITVTAYTRLRQILTDVGMVSADFLRALLR